MWAYGAVWLSLVGLVWALFAHVEGLLAPAVREAISRWLRNLKLEGLFTTWPSTFAVLFDRVFGDRHLSWKCFRRSCIASFGSVIFVTLIAWALYPHWFPPNEFWKPIVRDWWYRLVFLAMLNTIPDYFSLLETRWIIWLISRSGSRGRVVVLLVVDLTLTTAIIACYLGFSTAACLIFGGPDTGFVTVFEKMWWCDYVPSVLALEGFKTPSSCIGVFFYSTFFTSVWVWGYALSGCAVKLGVYLGAWGGRLKKVLDLEKHPLKSMALVANVLITLAFLAGLPFWCL